MGLSAHPSCSHAPGAKRLSRERGRGGGDVNQARLPYSSLVDSQPSGFVLGNVQTSGR